MSSLVKKTITLSLSLLVLNGIFVQNVSSEQFQGIGRPTTSAELAAWDIDVRPDFVGLPKGSGSVSKGQEIWEAKCASCHGTFGESNEVFTPIIGGTTNEDIKTGRVSALNDRKHPQRTTIMKLATISTLWDYIHRAMPWNEPRSLSNDDTFAVIAYLLNLAEIVPDDYVLTNDKMADIQQKMPNRNGMTLKHGLWSVKGIPDINTTACMKNCAPNAKINSTLPEYARNANGNVAEQNREYGPFRGVDTSKPPLKTLPTAGIMPVALMSSPKLKTPEDLFKDNNCSACHAKSNKVVGPSVMDIAAKYKGQAGTEEKLVAKVSAGGSGVWGQIPMPAQKDIPIETLHIIVKWVLSDQ